ncbi:MAG: adenylate/guanylate cyclase domain-containing protein [Pseudomonadota bacterium]
MLTWFSKRIGLARVVALALVFLSMAIRIEDPLPVHIIRNISFDYFHQIKPREPVALPVTIIDVDDASIAELGQWPWPRSRFAELVDNATADGAVAIAFDIIFSERDRLSPRTIAKDNIDLPPDLRETLAAQPDTDATLAAAFLRSRVIVGQTGARRGSTVRDTQTKAVQVPHAFVGPDPGPFLESHSRLILNLPELEAGAAGRGLFSVRPDTDGVFRRVPIIAAVGDTVRLGLGPELLRVATGGAPFIVRSNAAGVDGVVIGGQLIQTAGDGTVRPYLTHSDPSRFVSAADLILGRMPEGRLRGHLVFVGTSAIGLEDFRASPLGVQMAGVEMHAQLLENILSNTLLIRPNYAIAVELVVAFVMCLLIVILTPIMNATILIVSALLFLTSYGLASFVMFQNYRILIDPTFPIVAGILTIVFMSSANYLREERRRRQIRSAFGQYVSKDLVNELSDNEERLTLGGETREITLLFSDVKEFTAIAESFRDDPGGLTRLMNRFLTLLSQAILDTNGTIDKFMGDAVMAFWNAPLSHPDHAKAACESALKMMQEVRNFDTARQSEAQKSGQVFHRIDIGIGINTGSCTVGNMGSDLRFDYTAMGDPVNLASRLEGQSRVYNMPIIVGSATHAAAGDSYAFFELDLIRVKGKHAPERIFALLGRETILNDPAFWQISSLNAEMLERYRARDWDAAAARLQKLMPLAVSVDSKLGMHLSMMKDRIGHFRMSPPDADWDGVHKSTSK